LLIGYRVGYKLQVSPPPMSATFTDVPTTHLFFQYVEALAAAGITSGCGGGNFCPDAAVTRGQMAVFLAKALGLHWAP
jgi:S-layer homology domain